MGSRKTALLAISGGLAGLITWIVSEPFVKGIPKDHQFSVGSFYGWFAHLLLGALTAGSLALTMSKYRTGWPKALLACVMATVIGGALVCFTDATSDLLWIRLVQFKLMNRADLPGLGWCLAVALALSFSVALSTQSTPARLLRSVKAGLVAGFIAFVLRIACSGLILVTTLMSINPKDLLNKKTPLDMWALSGPTRLFEFMAMGIVVGLVLGYFDAKMSPAWLRRISARNEFRDYPLEPGLSRIGSAEGLEVPLFGDRAVSPLHATIQGHLGSYTLTDQGSAIGTLFNGHPVSQTPLKDGDEIRLGSYVLWFQTKTSQVGPVPSYRFGTYPQATNVESHAQERALRPPASAIPDTAPPVRHRLIDPFGNVTDLALGLTRIGRDPTAAVNLSYDPKVSRSHCEIDTKSATASIVDLGSANGTLINGTPLASRTTLSDGDQIQMGDTTLTYRS